MYSTIAVPVDLAHTDKLNKAITTAADLARHYHASLYLIAVTSSAPSEVAHDPVEFSKKLSQFADKQTAALGIEFKTRDAVTPDPAVDLTRVLDEQIHELGADLIVMASHVPGLSDYVFASNSGYLGSHTDLSIFVVR